ncbi:exonuclease domain-containing protein [Nitrosomonas sp. Is37]|uniref:exonuclease domain-containing protein n=1 Tax=Nitrosomonas sp. Is37 TaxID=3080535 RepID=UPI00294B559E|nr:exonuclease domain-containing protein [Nitrosomonas sp. Is37]MDV6344998.1 exonuclease domain-containing protein [Nitrosomonas sp. Is37]
MQPLAFVDLETTGTTASVDRITEVGIILVDGSDIQEWSCLINPETRISAFIERLTGITNEMVADAPTFAEIAHQIFCMLEGRLFVAHNARFDYGFLKQSFKREGYDFQVTTICTVKLSRRLFPGYPKHNLDCLIERHGLKVNGRHRALADAQLIHQFWQKIQQQLPANQVTAAIKALSGRPSIPIYLNEQILDSLPKGPGVYLFYGENELPLYVGKSKNLRQRILSHFTGDVSSAKEMSLSQQVRRIDYIETAGEIGALLKEVELVKKLQPMHNRKLRRNNELCSISLKETEAGLNVSIAYAHDLDFGRQSNLYGLFKNLQAANKALAELADEHGLCKAIIGLEKIKAGNPCFARQLKKCHGACVGEEPLVMHALRLMEALSKLRLHAWPFTGPAYLKENDDLIVIDNWAYLGTAKTEEELWQLLDSPKPQFDKDSYRILQKAIRLLQPIYDPAK